MKPRTFFWIVLQAWATAAGWILWKVFGDSWLLASTVGCIIGWVGGRFSSAFGDEWLSINYVSPHHPARLQKYPHKEV